MTTVGKVKFAMNDYINKMLKELSPDLEGDEKTAGGQLIHIYPDIDSHEGIYMTI